MAYYVVFPDADIQALKMATSGLAFTVASPSISIVLLSQHQLSQEYDGEVVGGLTTQ